MYNDPGKDQAMAGPISKVKHLSREGGNDAQ
jgi:hypothetical protein